ncbi:MAG TPA: nitrous oxide-stimulated promoter family protein [Enterococcus columbae]|nr:nitrous oxide-stimulated promoter family protein [Enterococcus columbae]
MVQINTGPIITEEKALIQIMIQLYYQKHPTETIGYQEMLDYALQRLSLCRFGEQKTTRKKCPVHCYQKNYREQMKKIMRYSGPHMLYRHPLYSIKHYYRQLTRTVKR